MSAIRKRFFCKIITTYFIYGYLCLFGIFILLFFIILILKQIRYPYNLSVLVPAVILLPLIAQFIRIIISIPEKYKFYKLSIYRLTKKNYKDEYFETEMYEPCFRLIVKDILNNYGYSREYEELRKKCKQSDVRVDRARTRLLRRVMQQK